MSRAVSLLTRGGEVVIGDDFNELYWLHLFYKLVPRVTSLDLRQKLEGSGV